MQLNWTLIDFLKALFLILGEIGFLFILAFALKVLLKSFGVIFQDERPPINIDTEPPLSRMRLNSRSNEVMFEHCHYGKTYSLFIKEQHISEDTEVKGTSDPKHVPPTVA